MAKKKVAEELQKLLDQGPVTRTPKQIRDALRQAVRNFYDLQRLRMQTAGRVQKKADGAEVQLHEYDLRRFTIRSLELMVAEKNALSDVEDLLKEMPIYTQVFSDKERFRGIGPTMAGVIISEFDINIADTASKFWSFAGLAPVAAMRCKLCNKVAEPAADLGDTYLHTKGAIWIKGEQKPCPKQKEHLTSSEVYESGKSARPIKGEKLVYNSFLRSKLVGVLAPVLLQTGNYSCTLCHMPAKKREKEFVHRDEESKCKRKVMTREEVVFGNQSPFVKFYWDFKHRWQTAGKGVNDAHRHQAAMRYMIKMLLAEIWGEWRELEKLPRRPLYVEEKLGHIHGGGKSSNNQLLGESDLTPEQQEELKQALGT